MPSNGSARTAVTDARRSSGSMLSCTIPNTGLVRAPARRQRPLSPPMRALHRVGHGARSCSGVDELVEGHGHVRSEKRLDLHGPLGRQPVRRPVEMRCERHPFVIDTSQIGEREDLESARVGEDRSVPCHEPMQPSQPRDSLGRRPEVEVVRVSEDHLRAGCMKVPRRQCLHGPLGADGHELGRVDPPVRSLDPAEPGMADRGRREGIGYRGGC